MKLVRDPMCINTTRHGELHVRFPDWPGWTIPDCTLSSDWDPTSLGYIAKNPSSRSSSASATPKIPGLQHPTSMMKTATKIMVKVHDDPYCDYGSDSPVFRARVLRSSATRPDSSEDSDQVIDSSKSPRIDPPANTYLALKFALREDLIDDLIEEANAYAGPLRRLQGSVVPKCYGLFMGTYDDDEGLDGGQVIACLALEHFGECLRAPFSQLPLESRLGIFQAISSIHACGLLHGDFAERNVLEEDGEFRIIDFEQAQPHQCPGFSDRYTESQLDEIPCFEDILCPFLRELCLYDLGVWEGG